jgi:hypothetical protein
MLICGIIAAAIAVSKGRSGVGWFFGGFFLGLIGVVIVAVIADLKKEQDHLRQSEQERRKLREQLRQEKLKNEVFRQHAAKRLDVHDNALGVDTRSPNVLTAAGPAGYLPSDPAPAVVSTTPLLHEKDWYYEEDGETRGPVSPTAIKDLIHTRRIGITTLVWNEDLTDWVKIGSVPQFRSELHL